LTSDDAQIVASLQRGAEWLARAATTAALAHARARRMQVRAERTGFRGIAASIGTVLEWLRKVQLVCDDTRKSILAMACDQQGIANEPSPDSVIAALHRTVDRIQQSSSRTEAIISELDSARAATTAAFEGGKPGPMLGLLQEVGDHIAKVAAQLSTAEHHAEALAQQARHLGTFAPLGNQSSATTNGIPLRSSSRRPPDGDYELLWRWAERAYDIFRSTDDADAIADNLQHSRRLNGSRGFTSAEIRAVRQHLFFDEQLLDADDGVEPRRALFDPDQDIADAWIRLRTGRQLPEDLVLLEHELAEAEYLRQNSQATYREAHRAANKVANWEHQIPAATREDFNAEWR
jgi:hypothetical protein